MILVLLPDKKQSIFISLFVSILLLHPYWALESRFLDAALRSIFGNEINIFIKLLIINSFLLETNKNCNYVGVCISKCQNSKVGENPQTDNLILDVEIKF